MALTTLTPVSQWDDVKAPNNGTKMVAVATTDPPPNDEGPVRQAFQQLLNRTQWLRDKILSGSRSIKGLVIDGLGDLSVTPTSGALTAPQVICTALEVDGAATVTSGADILLAQPAEISWTNTTAAGNPAHTVSVANKILPINTTKVICAVLLDAGAILLAEGCGWTGLSVTGGGSVIRVTFAKRFDSSLYATSVQIQGVAALPGYTVSVTYSEGYCEFSAFLGNTVQNFSVSQWRVSFLAFGKVTT